MKTAAIFIACLCLVLSVSAMGRQAKPSGAALKYTAMSFNVRVPVDKGDRAWEARRDIAAETIRKRMPDVIGFQEMVPAQRDDLLKALPQYASLGDGREKDRGGESCTLFYLKERWELDPEKQGTFWYSDPPDEPGSSHWGNQWIRICTWARLVDRESGRDLAVFNNHWDFSEDFHQKAAQLLVKKISGMKVGYGSLLIMGDLNTQPSDPVFKYFAKQRIQDAWKQGSGKDPGYTHHDFEGKGDERIDYFLVPTGRVKVHRIEVVGDHQGDTWPSDHFPLWAEMELR